MVRFPKRRGREARVRFFASDARTFPGATVAMSAAGHCAVARVARSSAPRTRAAPRRASRVVASASRSSDAPIGDVTRAVLSFHEGDRAGLGADDAVVPLASWAKRFGWDVETAERVLWECDVPTKGALQNGSSVGSDGSDSNLPSSLFQADDSAARVVDAADARVGLWVTHVFPDFVVRALLLAAETEQRCLSKRQALDAARRASVNVLHQGDFHGRAECIRTVEDLRARALLALSEEQEQPTTRPRSESLLARGLEGLGV